MDVLLRHNLLYQFQGLHIQFNAGTGVNDIKHPMSTRNPTKHFLIYSIGFGTDIRMVVTKSTFAPSASRALQQHELTWHLRVYSGISVHNISLLICLRMWRFSQ